MQIYLRLDRNVSSRDSFLTRWLIFKLRLLHPLPLKGTADATSLEDESDIDSTALGEAAVEQTAGNDEPRRGVSSSTARASIAESVGGAVAR